MEHGKLQLLRQRFHKVVKSNAHYMLKCEDLDAQIERLELELEEAQDTIATLRYVNDELKQELDAIDENSEEPIQCCDHDCARIFVSETDDDDDDEEEYKSKEEDEKSESTIDEKVSE